jgi:hypothetical protein
MEEITLLEEIWRVIINKYFTAEFGAYDNIPIDFSGAIKPATLVFAIFIAAMTATAVAIFNKRTLGRLVRRLISRDGVGFENAKTLEELGLEKSVAIKLFINRYALMKAVRCREEDDFYGIDPSKCDEEIASSIGIENTEKIKTPFWRKRSTLKVTSDPENPYDTTVSEENHSVALTDGDSVATSDKFDVAANEIPASHASESALDEKVEGDGEIVIEDSYAASLVADKKYKRKATDHFYLRPSQRHRLAIRYDVKGTNPLILLVVAAVCLVGGSLLIKISPKLLEILDGLLGAFNNY